jgi:flagellar biosynthesis/type III secretory pathway chaperone
MKTMQNILSNLVSAFQNEIDNYKKLLKVLNSEQNALLENEISNLANFINEEEKIIRQIKKIETERDGLIEQISEKTGIPFQDIVFGKLVELADEPLAKSFSELAEEIQKISNDFKTVNQCNKDLINSHREYIEFVVGLISEYDDPGRTYREDGNFQKRESMSLLNELR